MKRGITRIALVVIVVLGIFFISALTVAADLDDIPTESIPPIEQPGPRVAFWLTQMPKLVYVDGEEFELEFTAVPLTGAVLVWNLDVSTYMSLGSRFERGDGLGPGEKSVLNTILLNHGISSRSSDPGATLQEIWRDLSESERSELIAELKQFDFRYEPWASALDMLRNSWTGTGLCDSMVAMVSGPGGSRLIHDPCLPPRSSVRALVDHGPTGWYEFTRALSESLQVAAHYTQQGYPADVFVVNRGPVLDVDRDRVPEIVDMATAAGIRVNVVPMGNEPGRRMRFPYLKPLRELAEATGGSVYYRPNFEDPFDFSMLPRLVPEVVWDYYDRIGSFDSGTQVATRASLVLVPSEHVEILSPEVSQVATDAAGVRFNFQDLAIGERPSVDVRLRVSTDITETLLPVFRGGTKWVDPEYSYFEWYDLAGLPHRLPLPQRIISVTTSMTETTIPTPIPTPTPTATPSPTASPTPTARPTMPPTPTALPMATATPSPRAPGGTRGNEFYVALIGRGYGSRANAPYPGPYDATRVEIPVLDDLVRRFFP